MIDWKEYQKESLGKKVYPLLINFLKDKIINNAVDLGCGSGNETVYMLNKSIKVLAIDKELNKENILKRVDVSFQKNVSFLQGDFNDVSLPKSDLVISFFSLPFYDPSKFVDLWHKIYNSLNKNGYLICQLFGKEDFRNKNSKISTFTKNEIGKLLSIYDIIKFEEVKTIKENKKWHYYNIIVQKK